MKDELKSKFITPKKGLLVKDLLDHLEDELLNYESFPEKYLFFIEEIFSDADLYSANNVWKILHFLPSENLSGSQFEKLALVLCENFHSYSDYMLCDMSCDFIARTCAPEYAIEQFEKLLNKENDDIHGRSILVGLNILLTHGCGDDECKKRVKRVRVVLNLQLVMGVSA